MVRRLHLNLNEVDIDRTIYEIERYKKELLTKIQCFVSVFCDELKREVQSGFDASILDDLVEGQAKRPDISVEVEREGDKTLVIAYGEDAVWVEFGAGVFHNDVLGASSHPKGGELGFTIGGYGKGRGEKDIWGFYEEGILKLTRGTPAAMPMYKAFITTCEKLPEIIKEVLG